MKKGLEDIKATLARLSSGTELTDLLCELERVMDDVGIFAYKNWESGELVSGPDITKYWFKTTWMYPKENMPDPDGALRLKKVGADVYFEESNFQQPVKVQSPQDWSDSETKRAVMKDIPVWLVHIHLPLEHITDSLEDVESLIVSEFGESPDDFSTEDLEVADSADDDIFGDLEI